MSGGFEGQLQDVEEDGDSDTDEFDENELVCCPFGVARPNLMVKSNHVG